MSNYLFIDQEQQLAEFIDHLKQQPAFAIDTEFMRISTYHPQVCLLQIATFSQLAIIDPLAIADLTALIEIINDDTICKVMHAARQDLEIFYLLGNKVPQNVFDTQIGAAILGYDEQISYANLVQKVCNIELDKAQRRSNWSKRPLAKKQLDYAIKDVEYLLQIYTFCQKKLQQHCRYSWFEAEIKKLCRLENYIVEPQNMWKKIRGQQRLNCQQLGVLKQLASWREQLALQKNKPRRWIVSDVELLKLALKQPINAAALAQCEGISEQTIERYQEVIIANIKNSRNLPISNQPRPSLSAAERQLAEYLFLIGKLVASEHNIALNRLLKKDEVEAFVSGERDLPFLHGWRKLLIGDTLLLALENKINLQWQQNKLKIAKQN